MGSIGDHHRWGYTWWVGGCVVMRVVGGWVGGWMVVMGGGWMDGCHGWWVGGDGCPVGGDGYHACGLWVGGIDTVVVFFRVGGGGKQLYSGCG